MNPSDPTDALSEDVRPLLDVDGLVKHYPTAHGGTLDVLRGVSFTVAPGEVVAIIGESGTGKSTLLHLLGGLDTPGEGTVHFLDRNLFRMRQAQRDRFRNAHVGFVFQFYHLLPELNVLENTLIAAMVGRSLPQWLSRRGPIHAV